MVNKLESIMGKFIWRGRILRIAMNEIKNDQLHGGLKLPCVWTMNRSLLASQCIRLLRSGDQKSIKHIDFWMGPLLHNIVPDMGQVVGAHKTPEYFTALGDCLAEIMVGEILTAESMPNMQRCQLSLL